MKIELLYENDEAIEMHAFAKDGYDYRFVLDLWVYDEYQKVSFGDVFQTKNLVVP